MDMIENINIWITWNMIENMINLDYLIQVYYLFYIYTEVQMLYLGYHFPSKLCKFSKD